VSAANPHLSAGSGDQAIKAITVLHTYMRANVHYHTRCVGNFVYFRGTSG
jgi:hypothetical protein